MSEIGRKSSTNAGNIKVNHSRISTIEKNWYRIVVPLLVAAALGGLGLGFTIGG